MASAIYNGFKNKIGGIDWSDNSTTTIKVMLVTSSYTLNIDTHIFIDDVSNEVVGDGYTSGGAEIITRSVTTDTSNDLAKYDGDDVTWASSTITARGAVIYKDSGTPSTSPLIAYIDFGIDKESISGDFVIEWHTDGVFRIG